MTTTTTTDDSRPYFEPREVFGDITDAQWEAAQTILAKHQAFYDEHGRRAWCEEFAELCTESELAHWKAMIVSGAVAEDECSESCCVFGDSVRERNARKAGA